MDYTSIFFGAILIVLTVICFCVYKFTHKIAEEQIKKEQLKKWNENKKERDINDAIQKTLNIMSEKDML